MERIHITVSGKVQGVFFRRNTLRIANSLGLKGLVRNLDDGSVEIIAEGDKKSLDRLAEWCSKGPEHADVENVECKFSSSTGEFSGFSVM